MVQIYQREEQDGLSDLIKNTTLAYLSPISFSSIERVVDFKSLKAKAEKAMAAGFKGNNFGLYPLDSILASIGWNGNDDVFTKEDTWQAKTSAIDRPVNFMHNESDIIGHMTASIVLDYDGKIIPNDTKIEEVPNEFDVLVSSVLYTTWASEELQKRMDSLLLEIPQGKWFVSMECIFNNFDYAVVTPEGEHKTIARNNQTSFLTKHLRVYGGSGDYQGYKLGRKLKDFVFIGKGIVDNPANKRSLILTKASSFISKANLVDFKEKAKIMEEKDLLALNQKLDAIQTGVASITVVELSKKVDEVYTKQVADLSKELETAKSEKAALETKVGELEAAVAQKNVELATIKRLAKATVKGLKEEEANKLVETWANASEEQFDSVLALVNVAVKEVKVEAEKVIEEVQVKAEASLIVPVVTSDEVRVKASEWFKNNVFSAKAKK